MAWSRPVSRANPRVRRAAAAVLVSLGIAGLATGGCSQTEPGKAYRPGSSQAIFLE